MWDDEVQVLKCQRNEPNIKRRRGGLLLCSRFGKLDRANWVDTRYYLDGNEQATYLTVGGACFSCQ